MLVIVLHVVVISLVLVYQVSRGIRRDRMHLLELIDFLAIGIDSTLIAHRWVKLWTICGYLLCRV